MKEVILTMPVMVKDGFDRVDLIDACYEQLDSGWRFDHAQRVVVDRPDVESDDFVVGSTAHKIVVDTEAAVESELYNDL